MLRGFKSTASPRIAPPLAFGEPTHLCSTGSSWVVARCVEDVEFVVDHVQEMQQESETWNKQ